MWSYEEHEESTWLVANRFNSLKRVVFERSATRRTLWTHLESRLESEGESTAKLSECSQSSTHRASKANRVLLVISVAAGERVWKKVESMPLRRACNRENFIKQKKFVKHILQSSWWSKEWNKFTVPACNPRWCNSRNESIEFNSAYYKLQYRLPDFWISRLHRNFIIKNRHCKSVSSVLLGCCSFGFGCVVFTPASSGFRRKIWHYECELFVKFVIRITASDK